MSDESYPGPGTIADAESEYNQNDFLVRQITDKMAIGTPVEVISVSADGRMVSVRPTVKQRDARGKTYSHGIIHGIPALRVQAGGWAIIIDPQAGDKGWVSFAHSDISSVIANAGAESNPGSRRKFDWSDGVYVGGMFGDDPTQFIRISGSGTTIDSPLVEAKRNLTVGNGASGVITTPTGQVVTFVSGVAVSIV